MKCNKPTPQIGLGRWHHRSVSTTTCLDSVRIYSRGASGSELISVRLFLSVVVDVFKVESMNMARYVASEGVN